MHPEAEPVVFLIAGNPHLNPLTAHWTMTGEERRKKLKEQMKAEYKADLLKRKQILEDAKRLRTSRNLNNAIQDMTSALEDDSDDWIAKLNQESAITEAKMEMALDGALDGASDTSEKIDKLAQDAKAEKFSAEQLVNQMKREMGLLPEDPEELLKDTPAEEDQEGNTDTKKSFGDI